MSYSLNEIWGMCKRAGRGAGLSWGLAEDAANGARWLAAFDLPGPGLLAARLSAFGGKAVAGLAPVSFDGVWRGASGRLCPVIAGATLGDRAVQLAADRHIEMQRVVYPLLCCPFAADAAVLLGAPVSIEWDGIRLTTDGRRLSLEGNRERLEDECCRRLRCSVAQGMPAAILSRRVRGHVSAEAWACLSTFAGRTYAPATEESRRLGAGGADDG